MLHDRTVCWDWVLYRYFEVLHEISLYPGVLGVKQVAKLRRSDLSSSTPGSHSSPTDSTSPFEFVLVPDDETATHRSIV